jgi:hypothetical protein
MSISRRRYSHVTMMIIPALALTLFSSAFALPDRASDEGNLDVPVKFAGDDTGTLANVGVDSMLQPVPASLESFELSASGMALVKREGRDGPFTDAELALRGSVMQAEENYLRFHATGNVTIGRGQTYEILDAEGTVVFFKHPRGDSIVGLMHIASDQVQDEAGNSLDFKMRAHVMDHPDDYTWSISVSPAGSLGDVMLVNVDGLIKGMQG